MALLVTNEANTVHYGITFLLMLLLGVP